MCGAAESSVTLGSFRRGKADSGTTLAFEHTHEGKAWILRVSRSPFPEDSSPGGRSSLLCVVGPSRARSGVCGRSWTGGRQDGQSQALQPARSGLREARGSQADSFTERTARHRTGANDPRGFARWENHAKRRTPHRPDRLCSRYHLHSPSEERVEEVVWKTPWKGAAPPVREADARQKRGSRGVRISLGWKTSQRAASLGRTGPSGHPGEPLATIPAAISESGKTRPRKRDGVVERNETDRTLCEFFLSKYGTFGISKRLPWNSTRDHNF